jgi:hypothetical protein
MSRLEYCLWGADFVIAAIGYFLGGAYAGVLCFLIGGVLILIGLMKKGGSSEQTSKAGVSIWLDDKNKRNLNTSKLRMWHKVSLLLFAVAILAMGTLVYKSRSKPEIQRRSQSSGEVLVEFKMPTGGWMTLWGSKPPDIAYAVADATPFVPYKDQLRLVLVCRIVDNSIDELQDENIQKSPTFTPTQPEVSIEMHMGQALMMKAAHYPPPQMVHVVLVLIKSDTDLAKIRKLADVQPLGGTILVVNGFGLDIKTRRVKVAAPTPAPHT